ncbi:WW domain binding protein 11-domain-containing protein [Plectosphaerella plurivora]|uniref:WW domain binding protein 11-domain-containing protein n=1 Tax=Plectosphaerella plurivora TaxID=936078 RepID=A0A9P8VNL1_9PEZI|nr:WW domain binding protein 11-domain-containing protein [Plectosphaerella plurivora]
MAKEKNYNPVQAQRKADKAKAIKKGKSDLQARRNEQLSRRNPTRIQAQIDDLKAITAGGGKLSNHEEQVLAGLEKELKAVNKAREALGDKAPVFSLGRGGKDYYGQQGGVLGKRRRQAAQESTDDDVPDDVKRIPMPRDTPPPIPKSVMDAWWQRRRARRQAEQGEDGEGAAGAEGEGSDKKKGNAKPMPESKTVYEAKPQVRDLHKEAVSAFVPSVVRAKMVKGQGRGGLLEPEEADRLEKEGYLKTAGQAGPTAPHAATVEDAEDEQG